MKERHPAALRNYAAGLCFLNGTIAASSYTEAEVFLSTWAELHFDDARIVSNDPAFWPDDWLAAAANQRSAYRTLLTFVDAFAARDVDRAFRSRHAKLYDADDEGPHDHALRARWIVCTAAAAAATVEELVAMTQSPFVENA